MNIVTASLLPLLLVVGPTGAQDTTPFHLSVNVDLVVLNASVRDQKGRVASYLREQDFEIFEDGVRQSIRLFSHEDIPVTVGLVIDHSGSMRPKMASVIAAARTFIQSSSPEDQMFVVNFNEDVTLGLSTEIPFTNRPEDLTYAISHSPPTGKTALYDAVWKAREWVARGSRDKKVLVVVSDGGDNASTHTLSEILEAANKSNIQVFTIGIFDPDDPDKNPGVLRQLARATGGEAFVPDELSEVVAICESIAKDIRSQYTLGYLSNSVPLGRGYHTINVLARGSAKAKLSVRTRSGYSNGSASGHKGGER
uniref:von Willebrand factor, type A n=1 Tax=Solibacter usitatus (strain Ellin6076) TaxID=234267 RepID=Q023A9_SOLUE